MVAEPEVFALVSVAAELSPEVVFAALVFAVEVAEPEVVFAALVFAVEVAEPEGVFVALVSVADVAEPPASVDIALAFDFLAPVSVVAAEVDSSGHSRFFAFPNIDCYARFSNFF